MELIKAIVYGIVQGLTEYLPISSTAHIRLIPTIFGWDDPGAAYTAAIQIGTIVAVLFYFAGDILNALKAWASTLRDKSAIHTPEAKLGWAVFIGTIPIVIVGVAAKDHIETTLRSLSVVGWSLIIMGIVLYLAERFGRKQHDVKQVNLLDGVIVGLWQCIALIPGASRSGSTISGALLRGFNKEAAARFAFLLSIPSVFASGIFELIKERHELFAHGVWPVILANIVSFAVGYASIAYLMKLLRTKSLTPFVVYRLLLGGLILTLVATGKLDPLAGLPKDSQNQHVLQKAQP